MPAAVLDTASTGTPACCALGSEDLASLLRVGPIMAWTLLSLMNFSNTVIAWSGFAAVSSKNGVIFGPPLIALISSIASWAAAFCELPYTALSPLVMNAKPMSRSPISPPPEGWVAPAVASVAGVAAVPVVASGMGEGDAPVVAG